MCNFLQYFQTFLAVESVYKFTLMAKPRFIKQIKVELYWPLRGRELRLLGHLPFILHSDLEHLP